MGPSSLLPGPGVAAPTGEGPTGQKAGPTLRQPLHGVRSLKSSALRRERLQARPRQALHGANRSL